MSDVAEDLALADIGREFRIGYSDVRQVVSLSFSLLQWVNFLLIKQRCLFPAFWQCGLEKYD